MSKWITAKELLALWYADQANLNVSPEARIRPGLKAGLIPAMARVAQVGGRFHTDWPVPSAVWNGSSDNSSFSLRNDTYGARRVGGFREVKLSGLSFGEAAVASFANLEGVPSPTKDAGDGEASSDNRPPLSDAKLRDWWDELRRRVDPSLLTEAEHQALAASQFPDKAISRQRIRDLRGPQKRGPKVGG